MTVRKTSSYMFESKTYINVITQLCALNRIVCARMIYCPDNIKKIDCSEKYDLPVMTHLIVSCSLQIL